MYIQSDFHVSMLEYIFRVMFGGFLSDLLFALHFSEFAEQIQASLKR